MSERSEIISSSSESFYNDLNEAQEFWVWAQVSEDFLTVEKSEILKAIQRTNLFYEMRKTRSGITVMIIN